ncbi:MAG: hypothetical protein LUG93_15930, partial [Lachnospiraceae bacterium]|nr:hypothetical protein [Lachnospiraceae bacterium]
MKRCIVCGSIGDDDSTVCKVCGNPFVDLADESDKSTSMDEMERQLEQVWSKVQESAWSAGQADDGMPVIGDEQPDESDVTVQPDEPEVTVLPDLPDAEPVMPETVSGAAGIYSDSANTDSDQASQVIQEETRQPRPLPEAEGGLSAEEDMEPVQQEPQEQAQGEPSADKSGSSVQQEPQKQAQSKPSADKSGRSAQQKPQEQAQGKTSMDESDKSAQQKPQEQAQGEPSADKSGSSAQQKPQE